MAKGYLVARVAVHDEDRYAEYAARTQAALEPFGGRFVVRGGRSKCVEGSWDFGRTVVIEFPSFEQAEAWYESDDYQRLIPIRQGASSGDFVLVAGVA
jgi:uncharacterized protein (DUF1330 family)